MENRTKERILEEALFMFAENGYRGTNLRDLAARLKLSKSALYKHYASKEDIWNSLLNKLEVYYSEHFGNPSQTTPVPDSCEELLEQSLQKLGFTIHDRNIRLARQILLSEQFHDERACRLTTEHFLTGTRQLYAEMFRGMIRKGLIVEENPEMLAFAYTAPVSALVQLCDREPDREKEAMELAEDFIRHFIRHYGVKNGQPSA